MFEKSVAVVDIRSLDVTVCVAQRGVNGTFIIKSRHTTSYSGYMENEFIDTDDLERAIKETVSDTYSTVNKTIKKFYVGVPGEFVRVITPPTKSMSFKTSKKITERDLKTLQEISRPEDTEKYAIVSGGSIYYVLSDTRRTVNPVGEISDVIQAKLCYYMVNRRFISLIEDIFNRLEIRAEIELIPTIAAQAKYLLTPEQREISNILFDLGEISSSYSIVYGNGLLYDESVSVGVGHLAYMLMEEFDLPYPVAREFLQKINLNVNDTVTDPIEVYRDGQNYSIPSDVLRDKMRYALDLVCELIEECADKYEGFGDSSRNFYMTGEGMNVVRGLSEHLSSRLEKNVSMVTPRLPYYDKPECSSLFSLINEALGK